MLDIGDAIPGIVDFVTEKLSLRAFGAICLGLAVGLAIWWKLF